MKLRNLLLTSIIFVGFIYYTTHKKEDEELRSTNPLPKIARPHVTKLPPVSPYRGAYAHKTFAELKDLLASKDYGEEYADLLGAVAERYAVEKPEEGLAWLSSLEPSLENISAFSVFGANFIHGRVTEFCEYGKKNSK